MTRLTRRSFIGSAGATIASAFSFAPSAGQGADVTFAFISDVHACRMATGLSPNCAEEGKTDANLLRHITALNALPFKTWPAEVAGQPGSLASAGQLIGALRGIVVGGDMTDDGGGQAAVLGEGTQLIQFSQRYVQGQGPDRVHFPVYAGLGNHDLDQDGPPSQPDWYRNELRDYVETNHEQTAFFKPPVPVTSYDPQSDAYSWDWGDLHLVQLHRFGGDTRKGAVSALPWLADDLRTNARGRRPVVLFQHYGWDRFSTERWDPAARTFDATGTGDAHWWSPAEQQALMKVIADTNVIALFHGHEHSTPMIYSVGDLTLVKPKAYFLGGFALARLSNGRLDIVLGEAVDAEGDVLFTSGLSKLIR